MKRFFAIAVLVYLAFLTEFVLFNALGPWGKPELMVLVVVFCSLYWGIRHSLWAAFVAGVLKDAFGISTFGTHLAVYITAAYMSIWIRNNFYQPGSRFSRAVVAFFVLVGIFILEALLQASTMEVRLLEAIRHILAPQILATMAVATFLFHRLRDLAVKLRL